MRGGVVAGHRLGAATRRMTFDDQGQLLAGSFLDYAVPDATEVPPIETIIVEVPAPDGPFGAKGIGEAPVCGSPAAVANGVKAACGHPDARAADDAAPGLGGRAERLGNGCGERVLRHRGDAMTPRPRPT